MIKKSKIYNICGNNTNTKSIDTKAPTAINKPIWAIEFIEDISAKAKPAMINNIAEVTIEGVDSKEAFLIDSFLPKFSRISKYLFENKIA